MSTRRATADDRDALIELARALPLRRTLEIAFEAADDPAGDADRYHRWNVDVLLAGGAVFVDDDRRALAGGRVHPPCPADRIRIALMPPWRKGALRGRHRFPPVQPAVRRRISAIGAASMTLLPDRRAMHWSLLGSAGDSSCAAVGASLLEEARRREVAAFTTTTSDDDAPVADLEALGFQKVGSADFPDRPGLQLVGWRHAP